MSVPDAANLTKDQSVQCPESNLTDNDVDGSGHGVCLEKDYAHNGEHTTLLEKRLGVIESELRRLKDPQNTEQGVGNRSDVALTPRAGDVHVQAQEARIHRVSPWEWREVKNERAINPELPTLIVSSKGHGRVGRRTAGPGTARHSDTPGYNDTNQKEFDIAYRLAINSRTLLNLLGDCTGVDFPEDRNVWVRPFKYLVAYEMEIRKAMQEAEAAFSQAEADSRLSVRLETIRNHDACGTPTTKIMQQRREESAEGEERVRHVGAEELSRTKAERDQLRCLVDFMNSDMQEIFDVKRQVASQAIKEIAFEHLWLLYKPGDLVYTVNSIDERDTYQAYRVLHLTGGRPILDTFNTFSFSAIYDRSWDEESDSEEKARDTIRGSPSNITPFVIDCFSIDFDGNRLGPKSRRFVILPYNGKRKTNALEVCLPFFHPQHEKIYAEIVQRGRRFTQLANGTHKRYSGMTLRESRELWDANMSSSNYVIHEEEVNSEVMLDQSAAVTHYRKALHNWRLKIGGRVISVPTAADRREVFDPFPAKRGEDLSSDVFDDSIIDQDRRNDFINSTTLLKYYGNILDPSLPDDYVMLLPFRIYGYVMLTRKWFPLNINLMNDINPEQVRMTASGFEDLVLPVGHKKLLQAIVKNRVRDPKHTFGRQEEGPDEFQMDVVQGKGQGVIILLHGAPGVGKTSTAECVAAQLKRPLLPITCGDVSTYVKETEETLQEYCALAHRWRCVLLLDEADVFLAKREKGDLARNGLVSVFLRVLEYFSGVIILTTNRVGEFDEAFRSRIHVSLYYPKLNRDATLQIWERSLLRLRKSGLQLDFSEDEIRSFAEQHWLENVEKPSRHWNGRQIKNAFQTALALANWEFFEMKQGQKLERPLLKAKHFDRVAKTSAHFDDYISDIHNISEDTYSVLAARDEIRKDTHPAMSLGRSGTQEFVPRSRRAAPARRGAGTRNARVDEGGQFQSGGSDDPKVRQLELELELMKLKQASGKEEVLAQAGDDDEEEGW